MKPILLGLFALLLCSCWHRPPLEDPGYRIQPAGRITSVRAAEKYVIFRSQFRFREGQHLRGIRGGKQVSTLRVLHLQRPPHYAADLMSGSVRVGDLVEVEPDFREIEAAAKAESRRALSTP